MNRAVAKAPKIATPAPKSCPKGPVLVKDALPSKTERAAIVDEFGRLHTELGTMDAKQKRHDLLRKLMVSWHEQDDASSSYFEDGRQFTVEISAMARIRTADMKRLKARLGLDTFLKYCSFPMTKLDELVPLAEQTDLVVSERKGSRGIRVTQKFAGAAG